MSFGTLQSMNVILEFCSLWNVPKTHESPKSICNCKITPRLSIAISMALVAGEIESEKSPSVNVLLSHCLHFNYSLPRAWLLSLKIKDWPQPNIKYCKPNLHQTMTGPKSYLILISLIINSLFYIIFDSKLKLLSEKFLSDWPKLVRSSRVPLDLWTQLHRSFHYISLSPLNLIITARVPEPSPGLRMAMVLS